MEDELQHYGVKGMKWGVTRRRTSKTSNKARSSDESTVEKSKKSTSTIRQKIDRGKASIGRFLKSDTGRAVTVAAVVAFSVVGMPAVANMLSASSMDARYESMRGIHLGPIRRESEWG